MTEYQFFYRTDTLQIDAVYRGCKTESARFKDKATYIEVNVTDPAYEVSRDHKVVLDDDDNVIWTEVQENPLQPTPARLEVPFLPEKKKPWWRRILRL